MGKSKPQLAGKLIVMVVNQDDEREAFTMMLEALQATVKDAASGAAALALLEDYTVDLLIMDVQPPDMHGWQLIAKVKEIDSLRQLPVIVISDQPSVMPMTKPVVSLIRPVSIARLKQNILEALS
jgi:CheY-like chemotaxis protein